MQIYLSDLTTLTDLLIVKKLECRIYVYNNYNGLLFGIVRGRQLKTHQIKL